VSENTVEVRGATLQSTGLLLNALMAAGDYAGANWLT
jgi:hypothetical protein